MLGRWKMLPNQSLLEANVMVKVKPGLLCPLGGVVSPSFFQCLFDCLIKEWPVPLPLADALLRCQLGLGCSAPLFRSTRSLSPRLQHALVPTGLCPIEFFENIFGVLYEVVLVQQVHLFNISNRRFAVLLCPKYESGFAGESVFKQAPIVFVGIPLNYRT